MANEIQSPSSTANVASLVNPNTLSTLNATTPPKAFGDQTTDQTKQKIITADTHTSLTKLDIINSTSSTAWAAVVGISSTSGSLT